MGIRCHCSQRREGESNDVVPSTIATRREDAEERLEVEEKCTCGCEVGQGSSAAVAEEEVTTLRGGGGIAVGQLWE
uniref:Uncharacterized protein n=1 Tax=Oryza glaberrima TaxID=4538 RepID=I1Q8K6_ORYGL